MNFSTKCLVGLLALFLIAAPAVAQIVITGGPNAATSSPGAIALGGPTVIQVTGPGSLRVLASALWGAAIVPPASTGWAYADFTTNGATVQVDRTFSNPPGPLLVPDANANLYYNGRVAARVDKTGPTATPAVAIAGIGSAVARGAFAVPVPNVQLAGTAIQFSFLSLPERAHGYAQTNGFAGYNINNIGNTVISGGGTITTDEPARCYGNTLGSTDLVGTNFGAGLALIGTASYAFDPIGNGPGLGVSASALASFVNARATGLISPVPPGSYVQYPASFDASIQGNTAGTEATAESGEWDGSTPIGTFEQMRVNENSHSRVSGALSLAADAFEDPFNVVPVTIDADSATAGGLVASLAFHSASPAIDENGKQLLTDMFNPVDDNAGAEDHPTKGDYGTMLGYLGQAVNQPGQDLDQLFGPNGIGGADLGGAEAAFLQQGDRMLNKANPLEDPGKDPTVAATIVATGAIARRQVFGPQTRVTAESFVNSADVFADARDSNPCESHASATDGNFGSGAHLVYGTNVFPGYIVGSAALSAQVAFAGPNLVPKTDLSLFAEGVWGPGLTGRIEDDAGSYANMQNNVMSARFASTEYRTTTPELWVYNWEQGADPLHNLYYRVPGTTFVPPGTAGLPLVAQGSTANYRWDLLVYPTVNTGV